MILRLLRASLVLGLLLAVCVPLPAAAAASTAALDGLRARLAQPAVLRENTDAGIVSFSASAVHAEAAICSAFSPWFSGARSPDAADRFAGRPWL